MGQEYGYVGKAGFGLHDNGRGSGERYGDIHGGAGIDSVGSQKGLGVDVASCDCAGQERTAVSGESHG